MEVKLTFHAAVSIATLVYGSETWVKKNNYKENHLLGYDAV
jgi:hypothetical protein